MVGVGEMLAAAVIKEVVSKLSVLLQASVKSSAKSILSFKKDLNDMKVTLESINAVLADAEKRSINDEVVRLWLKRLKQAAYEISDMFDEFQHGSPQGKLHNPSWSKIILSGDMAEKMKNMIRTLKIIAEQRESYGIRLVSSEPNNDAVEEQETISKVSGIIVGRRVEKQAVINILLSYNNEACSTNSYLPETSHCTVIHGLGGVGKTELAKLVFNDETILKVFPQRAWVSLHQNWHEKEIARAIISIIEGRTCNLEILESIYQHLKNVLQSRCLIVLDNLWDSGQLEKLKGILGCNVSILVTSRREIRLNMPKATLFALDPLSDDLSRDLVEQVASSYFPEGDIPKRAVEEIVEMCKGVPLALKCVASLLKPGRRVDELLSLIKTIFPPKSGYGTTGIRQTVFASLRLTYHLMSWRLKLCFAYCAIFPKGYEIDRENLCHQWIALGLTEKMYAEDSIRELLIVSFLQDSEPPGIRLRISGVPSKLKMHDLVHDLAMLVAEDESVTINPEDIIRAVSPRYAMVSACKLEILHKNKLFAGLRALHIKDSNGLKFIWYKSSFVKCLRILDISGQSTEKLPSSFKNMKQLRYLNASGIQCEMLPKAIDDLSELQYLNLHGSRISALPDSVTKLGKLMHLDISDCVHLQTLPNSFCDLESLCFLSLKNCCELSSLPDDLARLNNLEELNLSGCSCLHTLPKSLGGLASLRQLDLSGCKKLTMLPKSFINLTGLQYLNISSCSELDIPVDALSNLKNLKYIDMSSCPKLVGLPQEFCSLKYLYTLNLSDCSKLAHLPEKLGQIESIKFILLDGCTESVRKPILQHRLGAGLQSLPAFVVETKVGSIRSNICQLEQEKFSELELYRLENIRTVDEAKALKMPDKSGLRRLGLMWTLNVGRFVEDEALLQALEPHENLNTFRVQGYMGERFPEWELELGSSRRGQLDEVGFMHFPMCHSLPHLGHLANLKKLHLCRMPKIRILGRELSSTTGGLRNLQIFTLEYMENLVEWCTTMTSSATGQRKQESFMFPALQNLNIYHCPLLTMNPCPPRSINWEVRESSGSAQLLLQKDEVMQSLADYMGLHCPFAYTTELHLSGSSSSFPLLPRDGWKFNCSLITLKDSTGDCCSLIDTLQAKGNSMQCLVNIEISGIKDTNSLLEEVGSVAYDTGSSLAKSWPDLFSQQPGINRASPHLIVTGYASCGLDGWIDKVTSFLGNLIRINMEDLPMCNRLPPLGQLQRLQELRLKGMTKITSIDQDFCGSDHSSHALFFPRLTRFVLNGMPNLEEWVTMVPGRSDPSGQEELMFPKLDKLTIWNCPKLKLKPCPPRAMKWDINNSDQVIASNYDTNSGGDLALQVLLCKVPPSGWKLLRHLPGIQSLAIVSCHGMEALPDSIQNLSSLQSLTLSKCDGLKHLPEWLGNLTNLERLMVVSCPLEFLPGGLRRLSSLRSLTLSFCDRLAALPGWMGDLKSLVTITIEECRSLKSLPQLHQLEHLLIQCNDELEGWCKSEVNQHKFPQTIRKRKGFLLESPMGTDHYILPARSLRIIWSNDDRYWRLNSTPESRFALSMELIEVWWLEIEGCIPTEFLCTDTSYDIYLVYKLANEHNGLSWGKSYVKVDGSQTTGSQMVSFVDEDAVRVDCVAYPVTRSEGWMELWLGEFYNNHGDSEVKVSVSETTDAYAKRGLIIEGMELRMKSL